MKRMPIHWSRISTICTIGFLFGMTSYLSLSLAEEPSAFLGSQRNTSQLFTEAVPVVEPEPAPFLDLSEPASLETTTEFLSQTRQSPVLFEEVADENIVPGSGVYPMIESNEFGLLDPGDPRLQEKNAAYDAQYEELFWSQYQSAVASGAYQAPSDVQTTEIISSDFGVYESYSGMMGLYKETESLMTVHYEGKDEDDYGQIVSSCCQDPDLWGTRTAPPPKLFRGAIIGIRNLEATGDTQIEFITSEHKFGPWVQSSVENEVVLKNVTDEMQYFHITREMMNDHYVRNLGLQITGEGTRTLEVEWPGYNYREPFFPDPEVGADDLTPIPVSENGEIPYLRTGVRGDGYAIMENLSDFSFRIHYNHTDGPYFDSQDAYGYLHINYVEGPFDFDEAFPEGLVIGLSSPDTTEAELSVGISRPLSLRGITPEMQYFKITRDVLTPSDFSRGVDGIKLYLTGIGQKTLDVELPGLAWSFPEPVEPTTAFTPLPRGEEVQPILDSNLEIEPISESSFTVKSDPSVVEGDGEGLGSGYVWADYSHAFESFNFGNAFPDGLVVGLSSPDVTKAFFAVRQKNIDNFQGITITGITPEMQYFRIDEEMFGTRTMFTRVDGIGFVFDGDEVETLNIEWPGFPLPAPVQSISPDENEGVEILPLCGEEGSGIRCRPSLFESGS